MKILIPESSGSLIEEIIDLGTKNSKTLGHLPANAYRMHAKKSQVLCAVSDSQELLGYVLFGITQSKSNIRITHLCIDQKFRTNGVARFLLDHVKAKYGKVLRGMSLSCRKDYKRASEFWELYGFVPKAERRSRSKAENYLVKWWYDFGNPDLFSSALEGSEKIRVLLDANVIISLRDHSDSSPCKDIALLDDWLTEEVDFFYAPEMYSEIHRDGDSVRAEKTKVFCTNFLEARFRPEDRDKVIPDLVELLPGTKPNDVSDRRQMAECISSGVEYFITSDEGLLLKDEQIYSQFDVHVIRPSELILMIDEIQNRTDYKASRLAGVEFDYRLAQPHEIDNIVDVFHRTDADEKKHQFRNTLNEVASKVKGFGSIKVLLDQESNLLGCWALEKGGGSLNVRALRTVRSPLSNVLFVQLLFDLIKEARKAGEELIQITDSGVLDSQMGLVGSLGFNKTPSGWQKVSIHGVFNSGEVPISNTVKEAQFNLKELLRRKDRKPLITLERSLWPVKFMDLEIPTYIIPIKPYWAIQLFDYLASDSTLFGSKPQIAWNQENVYYRSINPVSEQSPARILWYVSESKTEMHRSKAIVGCSYLDEVIVESAKTLFRTYKSFGIYQWHNVLETAKGNPMAQVKALRFSDTEVFEVPVRLKKINEILVDHGRPENTFASPVIVSNDIFIELYKNGTR